MTTTKRIKRLVAMLLVLAMVLSMTTVYAAASGTINGGATGTPAKQTFTDVSPNAWYYEAVEAMAKTGLIQGMGDGTFRPYKTITWGEFATILSRIAYTDAWRNEMNSDPAYKNAHWATTAMAAVTFLTACPAPHIYGEPTNGIVVNGVRIEDLPMTRGDAISCLWNFNVNGRYGPRIIPVNNASGQASMAFTLPDCVDAVPARSNGKTSADIPDWAAVQAYAESATKKFRTAVMQAKPEDYEGKWWDNYLNLSLELDDPERNTNVVNADCILRMYQAGMINGMDSAGTCNASSNITRAELCQMLYNMGVTGPRYETYMSAKSLSKYPAN